MAYESETRKAKSVERPYGDLTQLITGREILDGVDMVCRCCACVAFGPSHLWFFEGWNSLSITFDPETEAVVYSLFGERGSNIMEM
jgi:hypothetical protein